MAANKKGTKANAVKKLTPLSAPLNKSAILAVVAENAGITKKQVSTVLEQLTLLIESHLSKRNIGKFVLPGLLKIEIKRKPATKARKGINPFTGEETLFKAKPAHPQEQCYYIINGKGTMIINEEEKAAKKGDAIFIPSQATHGIKNTGKAILQYLTANPGFGKEKEKQLWPEK